MVQIVRNKYHTLNEKRKFELVPMAELRGCEGRILVTYFFFFFFNIGLSLSLYQR